jgi:hypothetical protein
VDRSTGSSLDFRLSTRAKRGYPRGWPGTPPAFIGGEPLQFGASVEKAGKSCHGTSIPQARSLVSVST